MKKENEELLIEENETKLGKELRQREWTSIEWIKEKKEEKKKLNVVKIILMKKFNKLTSGLICEPN